MKKKLFFLFGTFPYICSYSFSELKPEDSILLYYYENRIQHKKNPLSLKACSFDFVDSLINDEYNFIEKIGISFASNELGYLSFFFSKDHTDLIEEYYNFFRCDLKKNRSFGYLKNSKMQTVFQPLRERDRFYLGNFQLENRDKMDVCICSSFCIADYLTVNHLDSGVILCYKDNLYCLQIFLKEYLASKHSLNQLNFLNNSIILTLWDLHLMPAEESMYIQKTNRYKNKDGTPNILMGLAWDRRSENFFHWCIKLDKSIQELLEEKDKQKK